MTSPQEADVPLIDIRPNQWGIVRDILQKHVPQYEVWAFGSRAKWSAKPYSDLHLVVITNRPLPLPDAQPVVNVLHRAITLSGDPNTRLLHFHFQGIITID
ncbi:MAG: nucleotidyltransferase domain-containing protein [Gammaproteobacteria bacterium]|jgi:predicted nucleotidyltransferase